MDPQSSSFTPQAELWQLTNNMRNVQEVQQDHGDRLARLERRHDEDTRIKSVWGPSSPFPSALTGTPRHGPSRNDSNNEFASFDDDQSNNMVRSLHLDADDEPRRTGATSRANSVRFDESANQNLPSYNTSRMSVDMNSRTSSGFGGLPGLGGHPLLDRSSSHKSDGRHSSAGQSATSGRANSFGLDSGNLVSQSSSQPPALAPGHFILGSVPSIIRCWLNTDFNSDSILYAAVCTGSYKSLIDSRLVEDLGFSGLVSNDINGEKRLKLPVFLPEAVSMSNSSKSSTSSPRLPAFHVDFVIVDRESDASPHAIRIFIGSDVLRTQHADVLFSSNRLTMYDEDNGKWAVPFVRPENDSTFKSLYITNAPPSRPRNRTSQVYDSFAAPGPRQHKEVNGNSFGDTDQTPTSSRQEPARSDTTAAGAARSTTQIDAEGNSKPSTAAPERSRKPSLSAVITSRSDAKSRDSNSTSPPPVSATKPGTSPAIWNNWRRESTTNAPSTNQTDWGSTSSRMSTSSTGYNRPARDGGIKVLKPTRQTSRSSNNAPLVPSPTATGQSRFFDEGKRRNGSITTTPSTAIGPGSDSGDSSTQAKRSASGDNSSRAGMRENVTPLTSMPSKPRGANPVGGASAFGWLNSGAALGK